MKERNKGLIAGIFLCVVIVIATAARYEDVTFTQIRVKQLLSQKSGTAIKFNEAADFTQTVTMTGASSLSNVTASGTLAVTGQPR